MCCGRVVFRSLLREAEVPTFILWKMSDYKDP
jgi:hypothetical protein